MPPKVLQDSQYLSNTFKCQIGADKFLTATHVRALPNQTVLSQGIPWMSPSLSRDPSILLQRR